MVSEESLSSLDGGGLFPRLQQRFGLRANPLEMETPFFPDAMRHHALETLRHLCGFGDMALLLTGATGAGKTRILAELVRSEGARLDFHRIPSAALTSTQALARDLKALARSDFGVGDSPRDLIYQFFRWTESKVRKGRRMVLLIDDADRAPAELLRLLLAAYLASERASAAVPVFAGSDSLIETMALDDASTSVHQVHLRPLTRDEVVAYLQPRVHSAGGKASELLSPGRVEKIHALSQGSFGRLKRVTAGVWLDMVPPDTGAGAGQGRWKRFAWPALALVLLAGSWWFVSRQYDQSVAVVPALEPEPARKSITVGPATEAPDIADDAPLPEIERDLTAPAPVQDAPEPEPEPEFQPARAGDFIPIEQLRARNGWTIQLVAGNLENTALEVLERHGGLGNVVYTRGERQGKPWYMVFYGNFSTFEAASAAVSGLPESLRSRSPWIRASKDL